VCAPSAQICTSFEVQVYAYVLEGKGFMCLTVRARACLTHLLFIVSCVCAPQHITGFVMQVLACVCVGECGLCMRVRQRFRDCVCE
jgi:hypothetical protein